MASKGNSSFWTLLGQLRERLEKTWGKNEEYRWLFRDDQRLREDIYSYFGISGTAIAVANPLLKRFVLLQEEERNDTPLTIELPFCPQTKDAGSRLELAPATVQRQFSQTIHKLFILHRQGQALGSSSQHLSPEFLQHLNQGLAPLTESAPDYYKCDAAEVMLYVALWRWALYLLSRSTSSRDDLRTATFELAWNAPNQSPGALYCDSAFFGQDADIAEGLPEAWMLTTPAPTHTQPDLLSDLRVKCDSVCDRNLFLQDCRRLQLCTSDGTLTAVARKAWTRLKDRKQPPRNIKDFARELHAYCCRHNENKTILSLLHWIHKEARFPIIPYFYLVALDGPKEHLVIPIHRSEECAVWRNDTEKTTVVAVALFSLTYSPHSASQPGRIQQLEVLTRVLAERLMAEVFYGGIQRELSRQEGEANSLHQLLKDFKAFSDRVETFEAEWNAYAKAHPGPLPRFRPPDELATSLMLLAAGAEGRFYEMPADCAASLSEQITAESLETRIVNRVVWPQALSRIFSQPNLFARITVPGTDYPTLNDITRHFPKPRLVIVHPFKVGNPSGLYPYLLITLRSAYEHAYRWTLMSPSNAPAEIRLERLSGGHTQRVIEQITVLNTGNPPRAGDGSQRGWLRDLASLDRLELPWRVRIFSSRNASVYDTRTAMWRTTIVRLKTV